MASVFEPNKNILFLPMLCENKETKKTLCYQQWAVYSKRSKGTRTAPPGLTVKNV
jgi:hypothetical protein